MFVSYGGRPFWNFHPFPVEVLHKCAYRRLLLLQMSLHLFVSHHFVVQLDIFRDTPGPPGVNRQTNLFMILLLKKKLKFCVQIRGAANVWEVVVARSCVLFRSLDLPLSQALHQPGYVSGALIPTEQKKLLIDCCCVSCPTLQIYIKGFRQSEFI